MILFYTANSPYARTARIALREWAMLAQTEERVAANREAHNPVLQFSPVGRVPTLVDGDLVVTEARLVFDYIVARSDKSSNVTRGPRDWHAAAAEGQILGFLEGVVALIREDRRAAKERSAFLMVVEGDRMRRCLAHLEGLARDRAVPDVREFAGAALGSALELMTRHQYVRGWETAFPHLADWLSRQLDRPSMRGTRPEG